MNEEQRAKLRKLMMKLAHHAYAFRQCRTRLERVREQISNNQYRLQGTLKDINFLSKTQSISESQSLLRELRHEAKELDEQWNIDFEDVIHDIDNLTSIEDVPESRTEPPPDRRNLDVTGELNPIKPKQPKNLN